MPTVQIPPPYQGPTAGKGEIPVEGKTVRACLEAVEAEFPGFGPQIFDGSGAVHRFVKLFVDEEPIDTAAIDEPIEPGATVSVLAAIAGGSSHFESGSLIR